MLARRRYTNQERPVRLLIVEEDQEIATLLQDVLEDLFCVVRSVTPEQLLGEAGRTTSVLLVDLDAVGYARGERTATSMRTSACPPLTFLLSGDYERLASARLLADGTVRKPFAIAELRGLLSAARDEAAIVGASVEARASSRAASSCREPLAEWQAYEAVRSQLVDTVSRLDPSAWSERIPGTASSVAEEVEHLVRSECAMTGLVARLLDGRVARRSATSVRADGPLLLGERRARLVLESCRFEGCGVLTSPPTRPEALFGLAWCHGRLSAAVSRLAGTEARHRVSLGSSDHGAVTVGEWVMLQARHELRHLLEIRELCASRAQGVGSDWLVEGGQAGATVTEQHLLGRHREAWKERSLEGHESSGTSW